MSRSYRPARSLLAMLLGTRGGARCDQGGTGIATKVRRQAPASTATDQTAEQRIAALEAEIARQFGAAKTQAALYQIAELASAAPEMQDFYRGIHEILGGLIYAENMYIALYDEDRKLINFPFNVDTVDPEEPDPRAWDPFGEAFAGGLTAYVLRSGKQFHASGTEIMKGVAAGVFNAIGARDGHAGVTSVVDAPAREEAQA